MERGLKLGVFVAAGLAASTASAGPRASHDLQGTWDLGSYTELERPAGVSHLVMTAAEAEAYEAPRRAMHGMPASKRGEVGQPESEWTDRGEGLARVKGEIRSSTIVDPQDGKLPYRPAFMALAGQPPSSGTSSAAGGLDNPEELGGTTRCMATVAAGAPMLGAPDANVIQVMQTKDAVVILSEKYHDVRVVRLVASAAAAAASPPDPPSWLGTSVGWWEGDTLVVDTQGLRPGVIAKGQRVLVSGATRVTERFTRVSPHEIFYAFTVEDPTLLTHPWRGETTIHPAKGPLFEYACHEGNYSMETMLAGARLAERETAAGK
jgi:hypothetical protein